MIVKSNSGRAVIQERLYKSCERENNWGVYIKVVFMTRENLPYAHSSMASAFWNSEKGKIMICRSWYWSVLWPVIGKVMDQKSLTSIDLRYSCMSIRIIGRSNQLNVGTLFLKTFCITTPLVESWFQVIRHWWIRLQVVS